MGGIEKKGSTRREFVLGAGAAAGALGAAGILSAFGCSPAPTSEAKGAVPEDSSAKAGDSTILGQLDNSAGDDATYLPRVDEYETLVMPAPETVDYECDVLVVGGGLAGLNAAYAAAQAGKSVVLADKGTPGYSGLSAWPSCDAYYDPDLDADRETWDQYMIYNCDSFANLDWEDVWLDESKATYQRLKDWGWISSYETGVESGYWVDGICFHDDAKGYFQNVVGDKDRRKAFMKVLSDNNVVVADHTMIVDVVEDNGKCVGAVGVHFKSGTFVTFAAKSVVLCTGTGATKSTGFPVGADTFDGIWMGYQHGLPITGLEFEDSHGTNSFACGNVFMWTGWQYVEPVWPTGGTVDDETLAAYEKPAKSGKWIANVEACGRGYEKPDITNIKGEEAAACSAAVKNGNTEDERIGKYTSPQPRTDRPGGAPGMPSHLGAGVWCGIGDTVGDTGIPGLYVAGDGTNGCYVGGPNYGCQRGSTSNFVSLQGYRAGTAAAEYADGQGSVSLPADRIASLEEFAMGPLSLEKGFDPSWVRDTLHGIIASPWVLYTKSEDGLKAALGQVEQLRKMTSGKLIAKNPHDLRLCHEVEHQMLAMELKLHAGIERKESRGCHYRADYPYKNDQDMLCYLTFTMGEDGAPVLGKVDLKDRWKGDMNASYAERYPLLETPEEVAQYAVDK